jgi:SAM-dependent methyltransferase
MPPSVPSEAEPVWDGHAFVVGGTTRRILCYTTGSSGWNDELTRLHEEETAGGSHFIDQASRDRAITALLRGLPKRTTPTILEVGVSGGHFLDDLQRHFPEAMIVGADYTRGSLEDIADRLDGIPLIQMDLTDSPFPSDALDAIVLLNVLEHIEHDDLAISHCFRMLRPGGILVIEVPAGPGLYDNYDRELMHFRRYRRQGLVKLVTDAGFHVEETSHIGCLLYPPFWLSKKRNQARSAGTNSETSRVRQAIQNTSRFGSLGRGIMQAEQLLSRYIDLPIGIRCTAICRKPLRSGVTVD